MEYNRTSEIESWLIEDEQDFSLGAKATSFLPSATLGASHDNASFELPDWMESRENLGLTNVKLFDDAFTPNLENGFTFQDLDIDSLDEDYGTSIKPEDMLVPLSELQPQTSTPQSHMANPPTSSKSIPKIIICTKRVAVRAPTINDSFQGQSQIISTVQPSSVPNIDNTQSMQLAPAPDTTADTYDADDLIDEVVQMIGKEANNDFTNMSSSLDSSMEDLLSTLESNSSQLEMSDVSSWCSEPASPVSVGSPSPSQSTCESHFLSFVPPDSKDKESSCCSEPASPVSVPSPVPSVGSLSPSQSTCESLFLSILSPDSKDKITSENSPSYCSDFSGKGLQSVHSYSSPRKRKATTPRSSPYLESKRERKKEQNKQAALRYRQKKKQEEDELTSQINAEEERQKQLKLKYSNLKQELTYLKKIMREVFIAKGVISEEAFKKKIKST